MGRQERAIGQSAGRVRRGPGRGGEGPRDRSAAGRRRRPPRESPPPLRLRLDGSRADIPPRARTRTGLGCRPMPAMRTVPGGRSDEPDEAIEETPNRRAARPAVREDRRLSRAAPLQSPGGTTRRSCSSGRCSPSTRSRSSPSMGAANTLTILKRYDEAIATYLSRKVSNPGMNFAARLDVRPRGAEGRGPEGARVPAREAQDTVRAGRPDRLRLRRPRRDGHGVRVARPGLTRNGPSSSTRRRCRRTSTSSGATRGSMTLLRKLNYPP